MLVLRFTKTHTLNRIINYSTLKIFRVFNFRRNAISTKINYGENFPIYGTPECWLLEYPHLVQ